MYRQRPPLRLPDDFGSVDLICFSHLRWDFAYPRPQHLMSRFAKHRRTFFVEEPVFGAAAPEMRLKMCPRTGVHIAVPAVPEAFTPKQVEEYRRQLISSLIAEQCIREFAAWFYTPLAVGFTSNLSPLLTIYDCLEELSLVPGASPELMEYEKELFERADLVFTGGVSLFEAKCDRYRRVYPFPDSVDFHHFARARRCAEDPLDQRDIPHPRIGYAGVIDERVDTGLLAEIARMRPDWHIVVVGPMKIPIDGFPKAANIHYLGPKQYSDLPAYLSAWDAGTIPFALNDGTRFVSPAKTLKYLAAGLPVISTPIPDVVRPYGELGLARIAGNAAEFANAIEQATNCCMSFKWRERTDVFLSMLSWDNTWNAMNQLVLTAIANHRSASKSAPQPVRRAAAAAMRA
jgi:glycosyltransferase involved in cell wall biosynthesis